LKNENDSWIDEEETSRKWGARWLVARSSQSFPKVVYRLLNPLGFVVFKMGRLRGGGKEHIWID
jgi:hypothetical protein